MKANHTNKRASDTVLYTYLICGGSSVASYFIFEGKYFMLTLQMAIIVFLFISAMVAIKISTIDSFYMPPVEIPVSNIRWKKCIDWWNDLSEEDLMTNIRKLKTMNRKNVDTLLRAFEQFELFEKCSIIKQALG